MDKILESLPVLMAMLAAAVVGLWRYIVSREKDHRSEMAAKDAAHQAAIAAKDLEIKSLTKDLVSTSRGLDLLLERHEQLRAAS